ncbi:MAG: family 43 glycosylhydrolase [Clostridia bacterium]|nr:family 43 glycosylhydrolase [Clostridia bacterium]
MEQAYNPYLPLDVYIPDGEPHVFGDRVYIYGSHDKSGGKVYCEGHYEVWSAPVEDLGNWRNEGISYLRWQDPSNADDRMQLWAPDVTQGPDGRYYLYYCFSFYPEIGVAVSDQPQGPFTFLGHVKNPDGTIYGKRSGDFMPFDPAVLTDDDGRVYLYSGFAPAGPKEMNIPQFSDEELAAMPEGMRDMARNLRETRFDEDSMCGELEADMITLKEEMHPLIPSGKHEKGTSFEGHPFFEASSIRKFNGKYYFVYSSYWSHELCWAVSDHPDRDFRFGGILVSNCDIGLNGRENPVNIPGNNHGGLIQVGTDYYVFYHRQTEGSEFSRQGCAEKITMRPDGSFEQTEITSCGLNGAPLAAKGSYPAAIACHLTDETVTGVIDYTDPIMQDQIQITSRQGISLITNIRNNAEIGYKYFLFEQAGQLLLELKGDFNGIISISHDLEGRNVIGEFNVSLDGDWRYYAAAITPSVGKQALYLHFSGAGIAELKQIAFL